MRREPPLRVRPHPASADKIEQGHRAQIALDLQCALRFTARGVAPSPLRVKKSVTGLNMEANVNVLDSSSLAGTPMLAVAHQLAENGWPLGVDPTAPAIHTRFEGASGPHRAVLTFDTDVDRVLLYGVMFDTTEGATRARLQELVTRINYGLAVGVFEMDLDDGEIRYRLSIPAEHALPNVVVPALIDSCAAVDTYAPTFAAVAQGQSATAALADLRDSLS